MKKFYLMMGIICATLATMVSTTAQAEAPPGLDLGNAEVTNTTVVAGDTVGVSTSSFAIVDTTANLKDMTVANNAFTARGCDVDIMATNAMATEARSFIIATADATVYLTANALAATTETEVSGATGAEIVATFVVNPTANTAYCDDAYAKMNANAMQPAEETEVNAALAVTKPMHGATIMAANNKTGTIVHAIMSKKPAMANLPIVA